MTITFTFNPDIVAGAIFWGICLAATIFTVGMVVIINRL